MQLFKRREKLPKSPTRREVVAKRRILDKLTKRRKFLIVALILSLCLIPIQNVNPESRLPWFLGYFILSYLLSAWSLYGDLNGVEWLTNLTLPSLFTLSLSLFYFVLPQAALTQIVVMVMMAIGVYAILLTQNIFVVASIRTIQLIRAARAVGFLMTIVTGALVFNVVLSMRLGNIYTPIIIFIVSLLLFIQGLWSSDLKDSISTKVLAMSLSSAVIITQMVVAMGFWLVDVAMGSIFLSMGIYVVLGIYQHKLEGRLFKKTLQEYIGFGVIVFIIVTVSVFIRWGS